MASDGPGLACLAGCGSEVGLFMPVCAGCFPAVHAQAAGKAFTPRLNPAETTGVVPAPGSGEKNAPKPANSVGGSGGAQ